MANNNKTITLRPSWLNYLGHFVLGIIFLITAAVLIIIKEVQVLGPQISSYIAYLLILIAVITFLAAVWERFSHTYTITPEVIRLKKGILSRHEKEIRIGDIRETGVRQGIIQRIFGIGHVSFSSASTSRIEIVFEGVKNPVGVKEQIRRFR